MITRKEAMADVKAEAEKAKAAAKEASLARQRGRSKNVGSCSLTS